MKLKTLRNIFIGVGALFALARLLAAETNDDSLGFGNTPLCHSHPTFITFDPPGSTFISASAITPAGVIIGSYLDASGMTHGFLRTPGGAFTTVDVPGSALTTPTDITPSGVIIGWYCDTADCLNRSNPAGFLRTADGTFTTFSAPAGGLIPWL